MMTRFAQFAGQLLVVAALGLASATAATRNWDGSASGLWATAGNWDINTVPANGDVLIFPPGAARLLTTNSAGGASNFHSLTISGSNYLLVSVAPLSITNGLTNVVAAAEVTNTVRAHLIARASQTWVTSPKSLLVLASNVILTNVTLTLRNDAAVQADGAINGGAGSILLKTNNGALEINGAAALTHLHVQDGTLLVDGTLAGLLTVGAGTVLSGRGTVPAFTNFGTVAPGVSGPGLMTVSGAASVFQPGSFMQAQLNGTTPGLEHDQLRVSAPPNLTHGRLTVLRDPAFPVFLGERFVIITNTGAAAFTTTFTNLPQGALITNLLSPVTVFQISYTGGSGNDVELTVVDQAVLPTGVTRTWDGGGANNSWSNPTNWLGDILPVPGDNLLFPNNSQRRTNVNDFPAGFTIDSIRILDGGYRLNGLNTLRLLDGISASVTNVAPRVDMPLLLMGTQIFSQEGPQVLNFDNTIDLGTNTLAISSQSAVTLNDSVSGVGGLVKLGTGNLFLNAANSFGGPVTVVDGMMRIISSAGLGSTSSGTTIAADATLEVSGNHVLFEPLSLAGLLQSRDGTNVILAPVTLTGTNATAGSFLTSALIINAPITESVPNSRLRVQGTRTVLNATNHYARTMVAGGFCIINGPQPTNAIELESGILGGRGMVGTITPGLSASAVAPGESPGILTSSNLAWNGFVTFRVELPGVVPGTGHDQLIVRGSVVLNGARLAVTNTAPAPIGTVFTIIDNDGADAVTGIFSALPQGGFVTNGSVVLAVSYNGGDGNDVTLTIVSFAPSSVTHVWDAGGSNNFWSNPTNWSGDVLPQPGNAIVFPSQLPVGKQFITNDLAIGTVYDTFTFSNNPSGAGVTISGNSMVLLNGLRVTNNFSSDTLGFDVTSFAGIDAGASSSLTLLGQATFPGSLQISNGTNAHIRLLGQIDVAGDILVRGGQVTFGTSNNIAGTLRVQQSFLNATNPFALGGPASGPTIVDTNSTLNIGTSPFLAESSLVLTGAFRTFADCVVFSTIELWTNTFQNIGLNGTLTFAGPISGNGGIRPLGGGTIVIAGTNTYSGQTFAGSANLRIDGVSPSSPVALTGSGLTLSGSGVAGHINISSGNLAPGTSPGVLTCSNLTMLSGTHCQIEIEGLVAGAQHDQLAPRGNVLISFALLELIVAGGLSNSLPFQQPMVIIDNDGVDAINGTFSGWPEGATFTTNGITFRISYVGGTGNDVTLTRVAPVTGVTRVWDGGGANERWSNPTNWVGDVLPAAGDNLEFPTEAPRRTNDNDLAANTIYNALSITGTNATTSYRMSGNAIQLNGGLLSSAGIGHLIQCALTLVAPQTMNVTTGSLSYASSISNNGFALHLRATSQNGILAINGPMTGGGGVRKTGQQTVRLIGANTYGGDTVVEEGAIELFSGGTLGNASGGTIVSNGAALVLQAALSAEIAEPLQLAGSLFCSVRTNAWTGPIELTDDATIQITAPARLIVSNIISGAGGLMKIGDGPLILVASNSYTGDTVVTNGTLFVRGNQPSSAVIVNGAATPALSGEGTVGPLTVLRGNASPATLLTGAPARLRCGNLNGLSTFAAFNFDLDGPVAGSSYDQIAVSGTVTLSNAVLSAGLHFAAPLETTFVLIDNDGADPVNGTFFNRPEGALQTNSFGGDLYVMRLSYVGGDGNDVTLTHITLPTGVARVWDGGGTNGFWTNAINWVGDAAPEPGDDLIFPSGAARLTSTNTYPDGTTFNSIQLTGGGYTLRGNTAGLIASLSASATASNETIALPLRLAGPVTLSSSNTAPAFFDIPGTVELGGFNLTFTGIGSIALRGSVTGVGQLIHNGANIVRLQVSNSYSGMTFVNAPGFLEVSHNSSLGSTNAGTVVAEGALLRNIASLVVIPEPLALSGQLSAQASGAWSGPITVSSNTSMSVNPGITLTISNLQTGAGGTITKSGSGTLDVRASTTNAIPFFVVGGTMLVNEALSNCPAQFGNGTSIGGTGSVASIIGHAQVSPGNNGVGRLTAGSLQLSSSGAFVVELNGLVPGTSYDQLVISSNVSLSNSVLAITAGFSAPMGTEFVVIRNDGVAAVSGTFNGLPDGALISASGQDFRVSYIGGDGNDVSLLRAVLPTGITRVWDGGAIGALPLWSNPTNWVGDIAPQPGDALRFPSGVIHKRSTNDFPAGLVLARMDFQDSGYFVGGNEVDLLQGVTVHSLPGGGITAGLPIRILNDQKLAIVSNAVPLTSANFGALNLNGRTLTLESENSISLAEAITSASGGSLVKTGPRALFVSSSNNSYAGPTIVSNGFLHLRGNIPGFTHVLGGQLSGFGVANTVEVAPGADFHAGANTDDGFIFAAGTFVISNSLTLQPQSRCVVDLRNTALFSQASGRVIQLGGAELNLRIHPTFNQPAGTVFRILDNISTNAIGGTFAGLPEGSIVTSNNFSTTNFSFRLSYVGGDGNDVTLTVLDPAPPSTIQSSGINSNGLFALTGAGFSNAPYVLEATTNLNPPVSWQTILTNTSGSNGLYQFIDADSTNFPIRFYRVLSP